MGLGAGAGWEWVRGWGWGSGWGWVVGWGRGRGVEGGREAGGVGQAVGGSGEDGFSGCFLRGRDRRARGCFLINFVEGKNLVLQIKVCTTTNEKASVKAGELIKFIGVPEVRTTNKVIAGFSPPIKHPPNNPFTPLPLYPITQLPLFTFLPW